MRCISEGPSPISSSAPLAEGLALLRVAQPELERALGDADAARGDVHAPDLQRVHHLREAAVQTGGLATEDVLGGAAVAVEDELGGLDGLVAELLYVRGHDETGVVAGVLRDAALLLGDEAGEALVARLRVGVGLDEHEDQRGHEAV